MQHHGYGATATPGMIASYPSPPAAPPSYASPPPPSNAPYYSYPQPNSSTPPPPPPDYLAAYPAADPAAAAAAPIYAQSPGYTPAAPDPAPYSYATHDPSYSPRAPSYDRLPSHESSSFDSTPWMMPDYGRSNSSSSYGGGYNASVPSVDHTQATAAAAAARWGYDPAAVAEELRDGRYGTGSAAATTSFYDGSYGGDGKSSSAFYVGGDRPSSAGYDTVEYSGVYAYDGSSHQPYGSRGTGASRWSSSSESTANPLGDLPKLAKALPKVESESKGGGVQKYHVKLMQDSSSAGLPTNVVCQIGLDGVRLVDPSSGTTLRIYPLDTITKWEIKEPSVFTFWAKTAVDYEQRRTRLQSSSATTNSILDTLTAACVQLCEIVGKNDPAKASATPSTNLEKKASFTEWQWLPRSKVQPQEEKEHWVPDEAVTKCTACSSDFGPFLRRHHCRNCGDIFCDKCTRGRTALTSDEDAQPVRVCDRCLAEVTQRLSNTKDTGVHCKFTTHTHKDLAKKLQEEMERTAPPKKTVEKSSSGQTSLLNCTNCGSISIVTGSSTCPSCGSDSGAGRNGVTKKSSSSSGSGSRGRTREVACPTCTVHLEVNVPTHGSETIECGVCQHPFVVSA